MSFTYIRNNKDSSTDPCGTSQVTISKSEKTSDNTALFTTYDEQPQYC